MRVLFGFYLSSYSSKKLHTHQLHRERTSSYILFATTELNGNVASATRATSNVNGSASNHKPHYTFMLQVCVWRVWCQPIWRRGQRLMQYKDIAVSFWSVQLLMFYSPCRCFTSHFPPFKCQLFQPPYLQSNFAVCLVSIHVLCSCWTVIWDRDIQIIKVKLTEIVFFFFFFICKLIP